MPEKQRPWAIFVLELILIVLSGTVAWLLRFDFTFPHPKLFLRALPLLIFCGWRRWRGSTYSMVTGATVESVTRWT